MRLREAKVKPKACLYIWSKGLTKLPVGPSTAFQGQKLVSSLQINLCKPQSPQKKEYSVSGLPTAVNNPDKIFHNISNKFSLRFTFLKHFLGEFYAIISIPHY